MKNLRKKYVQSIALGAICLFSATGLHAAEEAAMAMMSDDLRSAAIHTDVSALRQERYDKMPYLDKSIIKSTINKESIDATHNFVIGGKKNLSDVVGRAIKVHTPALASAERINLAKRRVIVALRELFPEASMRFQFRNGVLAPPTSGFNSQDYRFIFRQPVFRGGILWHTLLQENAELEAANREYDQVIADLINDVSAAYFEYNRAVESVYDQQRAIDKVRRFAKISEQKWQEELISEIEHLNVQSLFSQMQYDYQSAKQELEIAKLELQKFLNIPIESELAIAEIYNLEAMVKEGTIPGLDASMDDTNTAAEPEYGMSVGTDVPNLEVLVDLAYQNRPELQVEAARLQSARLEERIRWGEMMPQADVVLEFGKLGEAPNATDLDPGLRQEFRLLLEFSWNIGGNNFEYEFENDERAPSVTQFAGGGGGTQTTRNTFTFGLLDGLDAFADVKEAEVEKLDQIVELENAEKEIVRDVKQAYYDYQRALIQVKSTIKRADYRDRLVKLARHRLDKNEIQVSEYVQAEIDFMNELNELHRALTDYFTAKAALNRAIGVDDFFSIEETL